MEDGPTELSYVAVRAKCMLYAMVTCTAHVMGVTGKYITGMSHAYYM